MSTKPNSPAEPLGPPVFYGARLSRIRYAGYLVIIALMVIVPEAHLYKLDLLHGEYYALGRRLSADEAKVAFVVAFCAINLAFYLVNVVFGRVICGWGCPVGLFARMSQAARARWLGRGRRRHPVFFHAAAVLGSLAAAPLFLDWLMLDLGTLFTPHDRYFAHVWTANLGLALLGYLFVARTDFWFCRALCPTGAYFTLLTRRPQLDLRFEQPEACIECDACIRACPTDLDPRDRRRPLTRLKSSWDVYPDYYRHSEERCFLCGDCIVACDHVFSKPSARRAAGVDRTIGLLRFGRRAEASRDDDHRDGPAEMPCPAELSGRSDDVR